MIRNLFSSFDPSTRTNLSLNWLRIIIRLIVIPSLFWFIPSRINIAWLLIINRLRKEFKVLLNTNTKGTTLIFVSLFTFILFRNFLRLFPYVFSRIGHLRLTLSLRLPLWLSFILFGWINNTIHILAHLVPEGTPALLIPFIVCIETIRNIIRPGTLAVRLTANIIAGHLLITLLGRTGSSISLILLNFLLLTQILLLTLETAVSILQAYVFSILRTLYSREVN